jgi:hypothetical protein
MIHRMNVTFQRAKKTTSTSCFDRYVNIEIEKIDEQFVSDKLNSLLPLLRHLQQSTITKRKAMRNMMCPLLISHDDAQQRTHVCVQTDRVSVKEKKKRK